MLAPAAWPIPAALSLLGQASAPNIAATYPCEALALLGLQLA